MDSSNRKVFGAKIRSLRSDKGWTQEELAERTGLHPSYIGGIERGQRNVGFDNILKLAWALDTTPSDLFEGLSG